MRIGFQVDSCECNKPDWMRIPCEYIYRPLYISLYIEALGLVVQLAPPCFLFCAAVSQELIYAVLYHLAIGLSHYVQR